MLPIPAWLNFWIFFFIKSIIIQSLFFEHSFAGFDEDSAGFDEDSAGFGQGSANYPGSNRILRGSWPHGPSPLDYVRIRRQFKSCTKPLDDIQPGDKVYAASIDTHRELEKAPNPWRPCVSVMCLCDF